MGSLYSLHPINPPYWTRKPGAARLPVFNATATTRPAYSPQDTLYKGRSRTSMLPYFVGVCLYLNDGAVRSCANMLVPATPALLKKAFPLHRRLCHRMLTMLHCGRPMAPTKASIPSAAEWIPLTESEASRQ